MSDLEAFRDFEAAGWNDGRAGPYHRVWGPMTIHAAEPLLDAAAVRKGRHVLDVACGPGYVAALAAARGAVVTGVDIAPQMIALARELHPMVEFEIGDAHELPFGDEEFDGVVSNFVMPHLADHARAVAELARVLRPGGALALTTWNREERNGHMKGLDEAVKAGGASAPSNAPAGPDPMIYADDDTFAALLEGAGLAHVKVETVEWRQRIPDLDELWLGAREGGVRFAAFLASQDDAVLERVRAELDRTMSGWKTADGYEFPMSAKLASGTKPR